MPQIILLLIFEIVVNSHLNAFVSKYLNFSKIIGHYPVPFVPLLRSGSKIKVGLLDYIIKVIDGAVTWGFTAIAFR